MSSPYILLAKFVGVSLVLIALYALGWHKGSDHVQTAFDNYVQAQTVAQQQNALAAKNKELENETATQQIADAYNGTIDTLNARLAGMRNATAPDTRTVRCTAVSAETPDATKSQSPGSNAGDEFYSACLTDALTLKAWQDWATVQHIPVR